MRVVLRIAVVTLLALITSVLLAVTSTLTSVALAATALIMGGTGHPLSLDRDTTQFVRNYVTDANFNYIAPAERVPATPLCGAPCTLVAVVTPEQFRFDTGLFDMTFDQSVQVGQQNLHNCIAGAACTVTGPPFPAGNSYTSTGSQTVSDTTYVVYGYSQSAAVATREKRDLLANGLPAGVNDVFFELAANPNRPNGGILERFNGLHIPILGVTFNGATPNTLPDGQTPTDMLTVDIARQYDGWADFPINPLNLFSDLNALMGIAFLHGNYFGVGTPEQQGQYGDTTYYMIPTPVLPLLMPIDKIPLIGHPIATALDPFFRVLVEAGYDRTINPGQPTTAKWLYFPNPISTLVNLVVAIPTGLDNLISTIVGNPATRPFGTTAPGPYGVGGPPVDTGCGTASCTGPTLSTATTLSTFTSFSAAKLAAEPPAPEAKTGKDEVVTIADTGQTVSPKTGTEQLTTGTNTDGQQVTVKTDNEQPTVNGPSATKTDPPTADSQDLGSADPQPKPKPKPFKPFKPFNPFQLNPPSEAADGPTTTKVRKPELNLPRVRDLVPSLAGAPDTPAATTPGDADAPSQDAPSGSATPAGAGASTS